jgi:hypothetical protein
VVGVAARKLEIVIPERLWEKLSEIEAKAGIRKEDIFMRAVVNIVEGFRCPRCGIVVREFV